MSKYYNLKVKEVVRETADAVTLHFKQPLFKKIKYTPGQFLTLILPIEGKSYRRSYSLCTAPNLDSTLGVTIKRVEGGVVSNYVNDHVKAGDKLEIMEPMGNFILEANSQAERHIVLIGGGSGITPLMSILKNTLTLEAKSRVTLLFVNRNESSIIFKTQLDNLKAKHGERFTVKYFLSNPFNEDWKEGTAHILRPEDIKAHAEADGSFMDAQTLFYVCGPSGLMDMSIETLKEMGVAGENIFRESFVVAPEDKNEVPAGEISEQEVSVVLDGQSHNVRVAPDRTILDSALDSGVDMPYSCQSGLCTACRGKLTQGKVSMDVDEALSEQELQDGYILTCQAHPLTGDCVVDMNA